jgi:hypothetical protein
MLTGRIIAAPYVAALGTAAQVKPPSSRLQTFDAARAARGDLRIDGNPYHRSASTITMRFLQKRLIHHNPAVAIPWRPSEPLVGGTGLGMQPEITDQR